MVPNALRWLACLPAKELLGQVLISHVMQILSREDLHQVRLTRRVGDMRPAPGNVPGFFQQLTRCRGRHKPAR